jgi:type I restriction enzyme, S subunit
VQSEPPRTVLLGEVADVFTGATPSRTRAAYWGGSIPWVTTGDIDFNRIIKAKEHITERAIQETSAKVFNEGTLLMAMYGQGATRGKVARLGIDAATNQACAAIVPKHEAVSVEYLFQVLAYSYELVRGMSNSGGQANLSTGIVRQIPIPLLSLARQADLVAAMACWDRAVRLAQSNHEQLTHRLSAVATNLFRTADLEHGAMLSTQFLRITRKNASGCSRALTISGRAGLIDQADYFDKAIAAEENAHYLLLKRGEFAYNRSFSKGYPFGAIKRLERYDEGAVSTLYLCFSLRPDAQLDADFATYFFESGALNPQLLRVTQAGARAHGLLNITAEDFMRLRMPLPSLERQREIALVLRTALQEIEAAERYLALLTQQKQTLAQHLLAGAPAARPHQG